ncbi:MAG: peptidylprolyl isomerase [Nanoarchaeota archaeon]|nr:peptidylprolyl isomerase [Nanoarchaeota archaeon]
MEKIENHDFVEVEYTGKLTDGTIFDTNVEEVAKKNGMHNLKASYKPVLICVGEKHLIPGLDAELVGKEVGKNYEAKLGPEDAFGKKDVKKVQLVPLATFKEHDMNPHPGMQVDFDGKMGTVMRISGGRVMVNFNHPFAGRDVVYEFRVVRKETDPEKQLLAFMKNGTQMPEQMIGVTVKDNVGTIELPFELPEQFTAELKKKLVEVTKLKEVNFTKKEMKIGEGAVPTE